LPADALASFGREGTVLVCRAARQRSAGVQDPHGEGYTGWTEAVVSIRSFDKIPALIEAGGFAQLHEGAATPGLARAWMLPAATSIREQVLHVPSMAYGYLRFVQIQGVPQQLIRPLDAKPWEAGGLWLIYTRARDDAAMSRALVAAGWPSPRGVHGFEFGSLSVKEVHHLGPEGMVLSIIEQTMPPMPLPVPKLTHAFNAAVVVKDHARARKFFVDQLGFRPWMDVSWERTNPGLSLLADSEAFVGVNTVDTVIVHPEGQNLGSVELIAWSGGRPGRDFSEAARPPNLGSLALRFAVGDLEAHLARLARTGINAAGPVTELQLDPYGRVRLAPIVSPDGVWLEFFEVVS
jgi:hypothetical protein